MSERGHLADTGMSYLAHAGRAGRIGFALIGAGAACCVHALVPALFTTRATRTVIRINEEIAGHSPAGAQGSGHQGMWLEFEI